jgi:hypothetical protein
MEDETFYYIQQPTSCEETTGQSTVRIGRTLHSRDRTQQPGQDWIATMEQLLEQDNHDGLDSREWTKIGQLNNTVQISQEKAAGIGPSGQYCQDRAADT